MCSWVMRDLPNGQTNRHMTTPSERCRLAKIYILTSILISAWKSVWFCTKMHLFATFYEDLSERSWVMRDRPSRKRQTDMPYVVYVEVYRGKNPKKHNDRVSCRLRYSMWPAFTCIVNPLMHGCRWHLEKQLRQNILYCFESHKGFYPRVYMKISQCCYKHELVIDSQKHAGYVFFGEITYWSIPAKILSNLVRIHSRGCSSP